MKRRKSKLTNLFFILFCTTIIVSCIAFSKYKTALGSTATAIVGKPVLNSSLSEIVLESLKPGESKTYQFDVNNFDDNNTSDVVMKYTIELQTGKYLPLSLELKKVENGEPTGDNLLNSNLTDEITIGAGKTTQSYQLTITWDETETNYKYSQEIDYVKIILNSYQVTE